MGVGTVAPKGGGVTWAVLGAVFCAVATFFAVLTTNAPLMVLGFWGFAVALCCADHASEEINHRASDSLNTLKRHRVGYEEDRAA